MIIVERTGPLALVQDLGRPGLAHLGVPESGAFDRAALRLGNRLMGNPESAAAVECLFGGLQIRAVDQHWVTVTGASTLVHVNGRSAGSHASLALQPGDTLTVEPPARGLRSYLVVRGGLKITKTLGSRASDVLSGLGPDPLADGAELRIRRPRQPLPDTALAPTGPPPTALEVLPGPRRDWFSDDAWSTLLATEWEVSADSNRVAVRLEGPTLERVRSQELPSEAMVRGAVQVPSSGHPLIFGPDHPVTGGYPVIAVLTDRACDHAAQLRPGDTVRLRPARHYAPQGAHHQGARRQPR